MNSSASVTSGRPDTDPIQSVELPGLKMNLLFRHGDIDVLLSDIDAHASLPDGLHGGESSSHLVVEGQALFEQGDKGWEVLRAHSLRLPGSLAYRMVNTGTGPLRLLTIIVGSATVGEPAAA